jgi:hypothetical protein
MLGEILQGICNAFLIWMRFSSNGSVSMNNPCEPVAIAALEEYFELVDYH